LPRCTCWAWPVAWKTNDGRGMKRQGRFESRRRARRRALQALYQWHMTGQEPGDIISQFMEEQDFEGVDVELFSALVRGVAGSGRALDREIEPFLDRPLGQVDVMESVILRMALYEMLEHPEVHCRVILDEAIDLAHRFGAEQGHAFVNGVLDRAARRHRPSELETQESAPG
jgi:N utilization substance protein B